MFQLILGISLGIILLFVILLLITEVAATYPVWKQYDSSFAPPVSALPHKSKGERNTLKILLLVLTSVGILCLLGYLLNYKREQPVSASEIIAETAPAGTQTKMLSAMLAAQSLQFRVQIKWEDGKLLGNNQISFRADTALYFNEYRFHLLDKEGFLVKELVFTTEDFVFETAPDGRVRGLLNRFNTPMHPKEYRKIEKLQVVLDKKIHPQSP